MLFKQCLNAVLIGIGHLVLGIKMYRKKHTVVFLKTSNVFQKTSNVFQKTSNVFSKTSNVFFKTTVCFFDSLFVECVSII